MRDVVAWERVPARPGQYAPFPAALDSRLVEPLRARDIPQLYTHQAAALNSVLRGEHVCVVTSTASGKTLCYNLPVLNTLLRDPTATALYLFPTKALANDQLTALSELIHDLPRAIAVQTYDGDTSRERRKAARSAGGIVITNPDMLHTGILPHHTQWVQLFQALRYIVVDELHTYRGIFGSHFANVLRRLKRICKFYGSSPQFILTSATIANPQQLAERLIEEPITLTADDGAPRGEKHWILINPPLIDPAIGQRRSVVLQSRDIAARFLQADVQTIVFARARLTTEVLLTYLRESITSGDGNPATVHGYRGGYLPEERRAIEQGLRDGSIRGVVSTNALELGVDIGQLDAAVLAGYPGTIASTVQQAGRSGRRTNVSAALIVASANPLDQFIITHPRYFFERSPEHGLVAPDNLVILSNHLKCAAFELPFEAGEQFGRFAQTDELLEALVEEGLLSKQAAARPNLPDRYFWLADQYPASGISLRTSTADTIVILDQTEARARSIGQIDRDSAGTLVHAGAVYIHEGQSFIVNRLDWEPGQAFVTPAHVDYYTEASTTTNVDVEEEHERVDAERATTIKSVGEVLITSQTTGFRKIKLYTHETLGWGEIQLPEQELHTTAYWFCLAPDVTDQLIAAGVLFAPNDYGPDWEKVREEILTRDGHRCRKCGAGEPPDRSHDVHHLRPFREFGYVRDGNRNDRLANTPENLITLCRACHHRVEAATGLRGALSGLGHVLGEIAPLYLMCDPRDIGVIAEARSAFTELPTITIYDRVPAGIGLSEELFDLHDQLLRAAYDVVAQCRCETGCPSCVGPIGLAGTQREELNVKVLTLKVLKAISAI
ncbi:RNA helicase CrhR [Thermoflexales bacterium]|nr:RNA helicase CrhR [Thermoflexales bacterium]